MDKSTKVCKLCGGVLLFLYKTKDFRYFTPGVHDYYQCVNCGVIRLLDENKNSYYPSKYYYSFKFKSQNSVKHKFSIFLYKLFFSESENLLLRLLFKPFKEFLRGTMIVKSGILLDVGCGAGDFLYKMKLLGMNVFGIEPSAIAIKSAPREINIQNCITLKAHFPKNHFDVITQNHVLEHSETPDLDICKLRSFLKDDGVYILATPNSDSIAATLFGKYWVQIDAPRHLFIFSKNNLISLLDKAGFKVIKIRYNSMPFQFISSINYYLIDKKIINRPLLKSGIWFFLFLPLAFMCNILKKGDQIEVWVKKN